MFARFVERAWTLFGDEVRALFVFTGRLRRTSDKVRGTMRSRHGESESVKRLRRWSLCLPFNESNVRGDVLCQVARSVHGPIQERQSVVMSSSVGEHESVTTPTNGPP
jgi:hypothetical protein